MVLIFYDIIMYIVILVSYSEYDYKLIEWIVEILKWAVKIQ